MNKYINYNWFGTIADHCLDFSPQQYEGWGISKPHNKTLDPSTVMPGDTIFVKTDFVYTGRFQDEYLPLIKNPFTLITGASSYQVSKGASISPILEDPNLLNWYCTNAPSDIDKITPLPIGFEESDRTGGNQKVIEYARKNRTKFELKRKKILLPYHTLDTNSDRASLVNHLSSLPFVHALTEKLSFEEYLQKVDGYQFVICLEGSGPDVHRNYEALLVGAIPVNVRNSIGELFSYYGLAGEFLGSWAELTEEYFKLMLNAPYDRSSSQRFLTTEYHTQLIKNAK
tara:strand:+ start:29235 stop:30089 length:855 start_codon:yes stop_codon:yes gene_type:complete